MVLSHLERAGLASYDRSKTNHEYLREFERRRQSEEARRELASIVDRYDYKWYSGARLTERDVKDFSLTAGRFMESVHEGP